MISPLFPLSVYAKRRNFLAEALRPENDILIFFNAEPRPRNNDSYHPYRADSNFLYYTGFYEAHSAFVLTRNAKKKLEYRLFCQKRDVAKEQWTGEIIGQARARQFFGADEALPIEDFGKFCVDYLTNAPAGVAPRVYSNAWGDPQWKSVLDAIVGKVPIDPRGLKKPLESSLSVLEKAFEHRLIKEKAELDLMRKASKINVAAHLELLKSLKPGMKEFQAAAIIEYEFKVRGSEHVAYNSICAFGKNATCLHYEPGTTSLKENDLALIDAGCEVRFYASDITRTYPASGKYTPAQKNLMAVVAEAHQAAMNECRPGRPYSAFHEAAVDAIIEGLRSLKFLKGSKKEIRENMSYRKYFPHGTGHWMGLDVHDPCPRFDEKNRSRKLAPGMVFTVEPGVYIPANDKTVPEEYRGIGIRIEDDVVIKAGKPEILTEGLPRYADEIEKFMKRHSA
jgi:Xaa-Pro aminopeptidase